MGNQLEACNITTFDQFRELPNDFNDFKKRLSSKNLKVNDYDKLFVSLLLLSRRPETDIFTTLTDSSLKNELANFKQQNRQPLQDSGRDDAIPITEHC